ncbi:MAG: 5'-nucleotidase C-terminal domain-containing protein [Mogibacterium sp.]|nr:5'-nucleotidase C-terminal domain-containing protein [Mogibacterium sp.]
MKRNINRLLTVLMAAVMILAFSVFVNAESELADDYSGKTVILSTNDVHGELEGYAYLAALKAELEARGADVILADAGDYLQGSTCVSDSKGESAILMMNSAGYDYVTVGNHEYDYGAAVLASNFDKAEFKVLCADILDKATEDFIYDPCELYEDDDSDLKIGFFGMATPETQTKAMPSNVADIKFPAEDEIYPLAQRTIEQLKAQGADVVVCLSHLGAHPGSVPYRSYDLLAETTGIDMVLDGHSHDVMTAGDHGEHIMSTGTKFQNIGVTVIDEETESIESNFLYQLKDESGKEYVTGLVPDEAVKALAEQVEADVEAKYSLKIAHSEVELNGAKSIENGVYGNRDGETNLGDLCADAIKWYVTKDGADFGVPAENVVSIFNGGSIRAWIHKGDVTRYTIRDVLPFYNTLVAVTVNGHELLETLEASTYCLPASVGAFPQIAGMNITIKTYRDYVPQKETYPSSTYYGPAKISRVSIDSVNGKPFDPEAKYVVLVNNFCAEGGDTYYALANASAQFDTGFTPEYALQQYIIEQLDGEIDDYYAEPKGRITIINDITPEDAVADAEEKTDALASLVADLLDASMSGTYAGIYTADSYKAYMNAFESAKALLKNADATTDDYLTADADLIAAKDALVKKAAQPMKVSGKQVTLKAKVLKKKAQSVPAKKAFAVSGNKGKITFAKAGGNKKITVNARTGKITVKKGLKKGTYKIKVNVTAAGDGNYLKGTKTVTFKIKVK